MANRTISLRGSEYPLILPSIRDPRLHVAGVILSVHALGQLGLHFQVSVPQILAAILTCAVLEVSITFVQHRAFIWPASAMLTGSGVALILRVVGTRADDPWSTYAWYVFAGVAGLASFATGSAFTCRATRHLLIAIRHRRPVIQLGQETSCPHES